MKTQILNLKQIVWDKTIYPRAGFNWITAYDYAQSMKAGAIFPKIVVALFHNKYYLVDGKHRIEALKQLKETSVSCFVIPVKNKNEIYVEAVKANIVHGRSLSPYEKANICIRLQKIGLSSQQISGIICIPVSKLQSFVSERLTSTISGEDVVLKAPNLNMAGIEVSNNVASMQKLYAAHSQRQIVQQLISLFETKTINLKNGFLVEDLKVLHGLIEKAILSRRKK